MIDGGLKFTKMPNDITGISRLTDHIVIQSSTVDFTEELSRLGNKVMLDVDTAILEAEEVTVFGNVAGPVTVVTGDSTATEHFSSVSFLSPSQLGNTKWKARVDMEERYEQMDSVTISGRLGYVAVGLEAGWDVAGNQFDWLLPFDQSGEMWRVGDFLSIDNRRFDKQRYYGLNFTYVHGYFEVAPHTFGTLEFARFLPHKDPCHVVATPSTTDGTTLYVVEDHSLDNEDKPGRYRVSLMALANQHSGLENRIRIPAQSCAQPILSPCAAPSVCQELNPGYQCIAASMVSSTANAATVTPAASAGTGVATTAPATEGSMTSAPATGSMTTTIDLLPTATMDGPSQQSKGNNTTGVVVGVVASVIVLAVLVAAGLWYYRRRRNQHLIQNYMMSLNADDNSESDELLFSDNEGDTLLE